jgi:hypothetical protein
MPAKRRTKAGSKRLKKGKKMSKTVSPKTIVHPLYMKDE